MGKIDSRLPMGYGNETLPSNPSVKTPWEKLISLYDAEDFCFRHNALAGVIAMNALRVLIPDYEERCKKLCDCAGAAFTAGYSANDSVLAKGELKRWNVHPFMRGGFITAFNGDDGDEKLGMCGRVNDVSTHRIEKELDTCPWDIMGSEICRTSTHGAMGCIGGLLTDLQKGPKMRFYMVEALGCGDLHCRIVGESYEKYQMPEKANWDCFGPCATEDYIKFTPEEKCFKRGQIWRGDSNFTYRNGCDLEHDVNYTFNWAARYPLGADYCQISFFNMLANGEVTQEQLDNILADIADAAGKARFIDRFAIQGCRNWLGVPNDINDGRVMGAYIEVMLQTWMNPYDIVSFNEEEVIYDIEEAPFIVGGTMPIRKTIYTNFWYGCLRSLVNCRWALWEDKESAPEGKFRIKIAKKIDKFSR